MEFNSNKSKVMIFFPNKIPKIKREKFSFNLGGGTLSIVREFEYLGIIISDSGDCAVTVSIGDFTCF